MGDQTQDILWQEGYGVFSISISDICNTVTYIQRQAEHHRTKSFTEEFIAFLKKHDMEYDEATLWD